MVVCLVLVVLVVVVATVDCSLVDWLQLAFSGSQNADSSVVEAVPGAVDTSVVCSFVAWLQFTSPGPHVGSSGVVIEILVLADVSNTLVVVIVGFVWSGIVWLPGVVAFTVVL